MRADANNARHKESNHVQWKQVETLYIKIMQGRSSGNNEGV